MLYQPGKSSAVRGLAQPPQVEFARESDSHDVVLIEIVQSHVSELASSHHNISSRFFDRLELVLQLRLLSSAEVLQLLGSLDQNSALGEGFIFYQI